MARKMSTSISIELLRHQAGSAT